ncbi:MAG: asparaginyl/glutamyl-tRNA amidotransferase subunit C [Deltaproteobacteria bacterium RBG_19FT_COMBO_58_16]|nr:MAG: asparaginyl/glutamyl-tRNA amidotransferase subunit C [Deltaproteobacteria bacterium RBG_19FT_COMBO_58_16]
MITREDVLKAAELARLALTEEETELYTSQIQRILGYVEKLSELDTTGVEPTSYTANDKGAMREDKVVESLSREEALANGPVTERGCFKVPQIIE